MRRKGRYCCIHHMYKGGMQFAEPAGLGNNLGELKHGIAEWLHNYTVENPGIAIRELSKEYCCSLVYRVGYSIPFGHMGEFLIYKEW